MFSSESWLSNQQPNFYNGVATQSLRFDDGSSASLSRTPSSASNRKTFVFSAWVKRCTLGGNKSFFGSYFANDNNSQFYISFNSSDKLVVSLFSTYTIASDAVFRDVSSWYHVVVACDVTQSTDSNRWEVYVNGQEITTTGIYPPNADTAINSTNAVYVGYNNVSGFYFDGYMAEVNFIDGLSFFSDTSGTPNPSFNIDSFGEFKNGVWIAKEYTGSYGTNGFRLQFNQTGTGSASSSTIGADTSGNANHFSSSGIVADDCNRTDSPENNHATLNPLQAVINDNSTKPTLSDGNLVMSTSTADYQGFSSTMAIPTEGKYAFKVKMNTESSTQTHRFGVGTSISGNGIATDIAGNASGWHNAYVFVATVPRFDKNLDGAGQVNGSTLSPATVAGDEIEFLVDMDNGTIDTKLNGSTYGTQLTGMPTDKPLFPFATVYESSSGTTTLTFTFDYTPSDSNYLTICTANLPEPTISPNAITQADDYFNTVLYTGTGASGNAITGVGFQPDWLWIKRRNGATSHRLIDSSRGTGLYLQSNTDGAEGSTTGIFTSFDSDGFTVEGTGNATNGSSQTYVAWNWKANGGTTSSNTDGSITSTVQANTDAGFSIVTYTGSVSGSPSTIGHGLGKTPRMIIVKSRSATGNWAVYHEDLNPGSSYNHAIFLNLANPKSSATNAYWGGNTMTLNNNLFSVNNSTETNTNSVTYVAYCFAEIEGFSRFGSFTGGGSTFPFVYTGFRPSFVMFKNLDVTTAWIMQDTTRDPDNVATLALVASDSLSEATVAARPLDFVSNGFKLRTSATDTNGSGNNIIYMAFAETPFRYANAR